MNKIKNVRISTYKQMEVFGYVPFGLVVVLIILTILTYT